MRRSAVVLVVSLVAASAALAHQGVSPWNTAKAQRIVVRDATVALPPGQREELRRQLLALIPRFRTLENLAWDAGNDRAASRIHNIRYRLSTALEQVEAGLRVASARCSGRGTATGGRFAHFRCSTVSEPLVIPVVDVLYDDEHVVPEVVEREPARYGPLAVELDVYVKGVSSIAYRQLGSATPG
jgi:hypothetical protein